MARDKGGVGGGDEGIQGDYYYTYGHSGMWYVYFLPSIRAESLL